MPRIPRLFRRSLTCGRFVLTATAASLTLFACGAPKLENREYETASGRTFSAEDRRIARSLTVGAADAAGSVPPGFHEMACVLAIDTISGLLGNKGLLNADQFRALDQARVQYWQRATAEMSQADVAKLRSDVAARHPEPEGRARLAVGCLRGLAA